MAYYAVILSDTPYTYHVRIERKWKAMNTLTVTITVVSSNPSTAPLTKEYQLTVTQRGNVYVAHTSDLMVIGVGPSETAAALDYIQQALLMTP